MSSIHGLTKPRALRPGARLAIVSPASTPKPELVAQGTEALRALGYQVHVALHALARGPLYYAGTLPQRVADLHAAFADNATDGILCTRGGWGSAELLPHLDRALIRANPKAFLGYSDHTSLHIWLRNEANLISFQAPMVAADFSQPDGVDAASWAHTFTGQNTWSLGSESGLRVLRTGIAEGMLHGGCLSIYAEATGTPYAPRPDGGVLFLEDIGAKPYQWDRALLHLRYAGLLRGVQGIVFGDMSQSCPPEEHALLESALLHALADFKGPVAIGLRSGHVANRNVTLPLGLQVRLDLNQPGNPRMHFLESAVED